MQDPKHYQNRKIDQLSFNRSKQLLWSHIQKNAKPRRGFSWSYFSFTRLASLSVLTLLVVMGSILVPNLSGLLPAPLASADFVLTLNEQKPGELHPSFTLTAQEDSDLEELAAQISFFPQVDFEVRKINDRELRIVLRESVDPAVEYKIILEDEEEEKSYEWAYSETPQFEEKKESTQPLAFTGVRPLETVVNSWKEMEEEAMEEALDNPADSFDSQESYYSGVKEEEKWTRDQNFCEPTYNLNALQDFHAITDYENSSSHEQLYHVQNGATLVLGGVRNVVLVESGGSVSDQGYKNQIFIREGGKLIAENIYSEIYLEQALMSMPTDQQTIHTVCGRMDLQDIFQQLEDLRQEKPEVILEPPVIQVIEQVYPVNPVQVPTSIDDVKLDLPDLVAVQIAIDPVTGFLQVKVENQSETPVTLDQDGEIWITLDGAEHPQWAFSWNALQDKEQLETGVFILTFPFQVKGGQTVEICLDPRGVIAESEEGNNCYKGVL